MKISIGKKAKMKRTKKILYVLLIVVLLVIAAICCMYVYKNYKRANPTVRDESNQQETTAGEVPPECQNVGEELGNVGDIVQPDGLGVERPITDYGDYTGSSDVGSVDAGGLSSITVDPIESQDANERGGIDPATIKGPISQEMKENVAGYIEKDGSAQYRTYVSWEPSSRRRFTEENYYTILVAVSKILEDRLNETDPGRYQVVASMPSIEKAQAAGLDVFWEIDDYGYLSIVGDFVIQDLKSRTEVEEIKVYTVYYEGSYLTIKE